MTDAAAPAPQPVPQPIAPVVAAPAQPDARMAAYVAKWADKAVRMEQSRRRAGLWLVAILAVITGGIIAVGELHPIFLAGQKFLVDLCAKNGIPAVVPVVVSLTVPALILNLMMQASPGVLVWWERKVAAHMQLRLGPMDVGGWHGWAQTLADGIKLLLKEIIEPTGVDKWVFRLAPVVVIVPCYLAFAPLPFGDGLVALDFDIGLVYVMAVSGLSTIGILMAGWGSANKFSMLAN